MEENSSSSKSKWKRVIMRLILQQLINTKTNFTPKWPLDVALIHPAAQRKLKENTAVWQVIATLSVSTFDPQRSAKETESSHC